ncbi:flavin-containing monooxygenase [Aquisediminimonas sediminicola]|uniref:flavin-containing monooxygenase n=1 Tax=Alteraquisediminimonas sediminicola TaxID=2676787 RepID=UPI001C8E013B|nr:NAD(P)/FAD-dependent oxidoreductase [Aquisediminimonas sediminicola]
MSNILGVSAANNKEIYADAIVIGAGFAGLYAVYRLREAGLSVLGLEKAIGVGGVWYWNRYPGARCDIPSLEYSYSFSDELQQEWNWKERFAAQPEILEYLNHVADRFDLRPHYRFSTTVTSAAYDSATGLWTLQIEGGGQCRCKYLIPAVGSLSLPKAMNFPSIEEFAGPVYHTSHWPHQKVDFAGKRVAVVGTGSSGVQTITTIAKDVEKLYVLQRTPCFSVPARNCPADPVIDARIKSNYAALRNKARSTASGFAIDEATKPAHAFSEVERRAQMERCWAEGGLEFGGKIFSDLVVSEEANEIVAAFMRDKIAEVVKDPKTVELLTPRSYPVGSKRMCVDTGYYEVFNQDNVELVDISESSVEFTHNSVIADGRTLEVDAVVMATGFDAMTGPLLKMNISADGKSLADAWEYGAKTMLGVMVAGFPNMFLITGPGSPSVLSNVVLSIEQHVNWIMDLVSFMEQQGIASVATTVEEQEKWMGHVADLAEGTLFTRADSWYIGANVPGKPRVFMPYLGGVKTFAETCAAIRDAGYPNFNFQYANALSDRSVDA